jgi:heme/copper-type cytochrome/quinol oxidase subunit 1
MGLYAGTYYYYPKITGRMMDERLGKWHFWVTFIGLNLTFFPMHFVGLNGMPRRVWRYDAGQGWEVENLVQTVGAFILALGTLIFFVNFLRSRTRGALAGNDPWGAPTIEWAIPSPPPDYNYAHIPTIRSRYPLWDQKSAEFRVPHATAGTAIAEEEAREVHPTAEELGIPMPSPTVKPLVAAVGLTIPFVGLIWGKSVPIMLLGAVVFVVALYSWLLTPVEPEHH